MTIADCWITLDYDQRISGITWESRNFKAVYGSEWKAYINKQLSNLFCICFEGTRKLFVWKDECFDSLEITIPGKNTVILLKKRSNKILLYEQTFDAILDGIQIYDENACLVYVNKASRKISSIPGHLDVEGRHLMDLYDLKEDVSTVMTSLRTRMPVVNRFDHFKSTTGITISSVNTAYPVFNEHKLLGAVVFEQNLFSIEEQIEKQEEIKKIIKEKVSLPAATFNGYQFSDLVGQSPNFLASVLLAKKIAVQHCNVLLIGETGTGKEIFAQGIHKSSDRKKNTFVAINCAAVPEQLIESVFFGTSKGSFTGSIDKAGLLEEAHGGVIFLDELNSMSLSMQSKLLRVIQEGSFRRVGGRQDIQANIRFISSCNADPADLIERNILRKDLFYRLSTITINIPPLRERPDDIEELVKFYLGKNITRYAKSINDISPQVISLFKKYSWPGNIRELFNVLDYVLNTIESDTIEVNHLPKPLQLFGEQSTFSSLPVAGNSAEMPAEKHFFEKAILNKMQGGSDLKKVLDTIEKKLIENTLSQCRYNISKSAKLLGLSRQKLQYRMKKLRIE